MTSAAEREYVLAEVIDQFLPHPSDEEHAVRPERDHMLAELRRKARIKPSDDSVSARAKLLEAATEELTELVLGGDRLAEAKGRAGARGELPLSEFEVVFPDEFAESEKLGTRREHVMRAIQNPTGVDDLAPRGLWEGSKLSLVSKDEGKFVLLLFARRDGAKLSIHPTFRVYKEDVDQLGHEPLQVLQAFLRRFGLPVIVGELPPTKFVQYEVIPLPPDAVPMGNNNWMTKIIKVHSSPGQTVKVVWTARATLLRLMEIAWAFAVDMGAYTESLKAHGVRTS